jgi:methylmalonyl-CoA mutase N-terminal domain/subunit
VYGCTIEQYVERQTKKIKEKTQKHIERLKAMGGGNISLRKERVK